MAERSRPWSGIVLGDSGPYSDDQWTDTWASLAGPLVASEGVFRRQLNELNVTGAVSPVSVNTGRAMVDGTWYESDVAVTVAIPSPAANPRIDRIVLRKDWALQTVRIIRIAGAEGAAPVPPAITQVDGVTWDTPLFQVRIIVAGTITIYADERDFIGQYEPALYVREDEVWIQDDFFEGTDFANAEERRIWTAIITAGAGNGIFRSVIRPGRGVIGLQHGAAAVDLITLESGNYTPDAVNARLKVIAYEPATDANLDRFIGFTLGGAALLSAEMVGFINDAGVDNNWHSLTRTGSVSTDNNTGIALDATWKVLEIKSRGTGVVEFWIDSVLVQVHTTNIPAAQTMQLWLAIIAKGVAPVSQDYQFVDMVTMVGDR